MNDNTNTTQGNSTVPEFSATPDAGNDASGKSKSEKSSINKNEAMLAEGSFPQLLVKLCIPTVVVILVMIIYNMADTYFIGQTGDPNKIAAISLSMPFFTILSGVATLFGNGGCTSISMALGRKDHTKIKSFCSICCYSALAVGIAFMLIVLFAIHPIATMLGADENTMEYTCQYLMIFSLGAPFVMFNQTYNCVVRADGAASQSMVSNLLGTVSNIVLDALFIMVFHWDVAGAALATVIGNMLTSIYLVYYLWKKQPAFRPYPKYFTFRKEYFLPVVTLGLPMCCSTMLNSVSHMISNRMMIGYGSVALSAQSVAGKLSMVITMLLMAICMGIQPAISYNYGRGDLKRMYGIIRQTGIFTVVLGFVLSTGCYIARTPIISAFIDNAEVIEYGQIMVLASICTGPFYGIYQLCQTFMQSTGQATYATFTALLDKGLFFLPILFIMNHAFQMYGIAFSAAVTLAFSLVVAVTLALKWNKTIKETEKNTGQNTEGAKVEQHAAI